MIKLKKFLIFFILLFVAFIFPVKILAATPTPVPINLPEIFCVGNNPDQRTSNPVSGKIATAIGCIPFLSFQEMAKFFLKWGIGIAGGVCFILIVISGYMIITSSADPHRLQSGKELLTAALSGLVLLMLSAYILRVIGVNILALPGF